MFSFRNCSAFLITIFISVAITFVSENVHSQAISGQDKGVYFHRQYSSSEYNGHTQNWAVTEDANGLVYIGNGNGLLEYDGVDWRMIEVAGGQVALSLALGHNDQIYVGSVNDFGVIRPDSLARPVFNSMTDKVPEELLDFEDVWETKAYSGGVLSRTRDAVFHVEYDDSLTVIRPEERFERMHRIGDEIYIVDLGEGLMKLENMQFNLVPDGEQFMDLSVWYMAERPDGTIFIATRNGTYLFDGESIEPFETEIAPILTDQNVYHATDIEGKGYAFATIRGGVYVTDYDGNVTDVIDSSYLTTNQSTYVYSDRMNNLWVATTNGLNRVEISNPLTYFDQTTGLVSGITDIARHEGKIFVASSSDVQYMQEGSDEKDIPRFVTIPSDITGFNLLESTEYGLLASTLNGLVEVSENGIAAISPELEGIVVSQSAQNPETVLLGHRDGVALYEYTDGEWSFSSSVEGVNEQVYTLEQGVDGVIWAGTEFQGLIRIDLRDSIQVDRFDTEEHFNSGSARVYQVYGEVFISTETGIYQPSILWNEEQPFIPDVTTLLMEDPSPTGTMEIEKAPDGGYWVVTDGATGFSPTLENPLVNLSEGALARVASDGVKSILPGENGILWVVSESGLIRYDSNFDYPGNIPFDALVRGALQNDEPVFGGMKDSTLAQLQLLYEQNDMRFLFGTNFIEDENQTRYQVRLSGLDDDWSNWTSESFKDYTNIPHGDYTVEVRARNTYGQISSTGAYTFTILPPWWFSWWAYAGYFLLFAGFVFTIDRFQRKRLIKKERERSREKELEQAREIEIAYENLKAAKEQLVQQEKLASLGQLTAGIAHEIKNPLNFVNNFSELSVELIEEAREEVKKQKAEVKSEKGESPLEGSAEAERKRGVSGGDERPEVDDVISVSDETSSLLLDILDDIETNLKTIHKHGSRADSIVKSMLETSRGGSGTLEPTKLNALVKEFANLAFHGMRAGKDPINVEMIYELEDSVGEIPLIAEDFSRVIVNLSNNAFDAMRERQGTGRKGQGAGGPGNEKNSPLEGSAEAERRRGVSGYVPKLTVRTKSQSDTVTIEIEDNGPGIPDEMKDKILQPFFTTKKGTQGTGLGLSITNDIIKAHGGTLDIDSSEGKTIFSITLQNSL
jgi:signal transduction histidine kinase